MINLTCLELNNGRFPAKQYSGQVIPNLKNI